MKPAKKLKPDMHMGIFGGTGSGKSYTASVIHSEVDQAIYFNYPEKEADDYTIEGLEADGNTPHKLTRKAMRDGKKIKYKPHWKPDIADQELRSIYNQVAKKVTGDVYLFVDEAHLFDEGLLYALRDGRGHNVHIVPITQRPKDMDTTAISQINEFLIYRLAPQQKPWFSQMNMPFQDIKDHTSQDYHFVYWDQSEEGFEKLPPIPYSN